jgi:seryl-tRNA synthetase
MNMMSDVIAGQAGNQINLPLPAKITGGRLSEFLERVPYLDVAVTSVRYVEDGHAAVIDTVPLSDEQGAKIAADLQELLAALIESKILAQKILKTQARPEQASAFEQAGESQVFYGRSEIRLMDAVDKLLLAVADRHGAVQRDYASIYSAQIMGRSGYHKNFPQNVFGVTQIPHNYTLIKKIREDASSTIGADMFESHGAYLQPCVCYHCYAEVQQSKRDSAIFTTKGRCFRHEIQWRLNQFRRNEFTMREIVFIGTPEYVEAKRLGMMEEVWALFCELGLYGQIVTARDPFFHYDDMKTKGAVQLMADAKYELEFASRAGSASSIASFNNCQDTLCQKFEITATHNDEFLHSGCVAFGIDRWRAALLEEYGQDEGNWPALLK